MRAQLAQLVGGCAVLGIGVALLLLAALGSDGYSTLVSGLARTTDLSFLVVNIAVSLAFIAVAWARGLAPGLGTVVQPVVVGLTVSLILGAAGEPEGLAVRLLLLVLAVPVLALGVAAYLASRTGAGPAEAAALAFDPPLPFRWSYSTLQGGGAATGWLLGAAVGPGTLVVVFALGPMVDVLTNRLVARWAPPAKPSADAGDTPR